MKPIDIITEDKKQMDIYAKQIECYCKLCNAEIGVLHIYNTKVFFELAYDANAKINKDGNFLDFTYNGIIFKNIFDLDDEDE